MCHHCHSCLLSVAVKVLNKVCTLHQMSHSQGRDNLSGEVCCWISLALVGEVSYYYALLRPFGKEMRCVFPLRPLLTGITNADTPSKSQLAADEVAEEVVELVDPLYFAMVDAVSWTQA